jgi:hypothetical protein
VDMTATGTELQCPSCSETITVPEPEPQTLQAINPISTSAAAKEEKHFVVPNRSTPESLIKKPPPPLEAAAKDDRKRMRVKTIKHGDCVEVGKDRFDEVVSEYLDKIGETNIVSLTPITYSHTDIATRQMMTDFAVIIIYRG